MELRLVDVIIIGAGAIGSAIAGNAMYDLDIVVVEKESDAPAEPARLTAVAWTMGYHDSCYLWGVCAGMQCCRIGQRQYSLRQTGSLLVA